MPKGKQKQKLKPKNKTTKPNQQNTQRTKSDTMKVDHAAWLGDNDLCIIK
jgi:hypothetical protein